jgi:hypothetical protein
MMGTKCSFPTIEYIYIKKNMKKEYWIVEEERIGDFDSHEEKQLECTGPFRSAKDAEKRLREDCSRSFRLGEHENLEEYSYQDFCSKFKIVQTVKTVQPIPVVTVKSKLKTI